MKLQLAAAVLLWLCVIAVIALLEGCASTHGPELQLHDVEAATWRSPGRWNERLEYGLTAECVPLGPVSSVLRAQVGDAVSGAVVCDTSAEARFSILDICDAWTGGDLVGTFTLDHEPIGPEVFVFTEADMRQRCSR